MEAILNSMNLIVYSLIISMFVLALLVGVSSYKKVSIDWKLLVLYVAFTAMIGPIGEVFVGTIYSFVFSEPLWQYQVLAIHSDYTSLIAPVIWGVSGIFLYVSRELLGLKFSKRTRHQALIIMVETILFEAVLNIGFLLLSGSLLFYYTPGEFAHITSIQTLPFYFLFGLVFIKTIKRFSLDTKFFTLMSLMLLIVFVYF